jgi:hypothetical protein
MHPTSLTLNRITNQDGYLRAEWLYVPPANWRPTGGDKDGIMMKRIRTDDNLMQMEANAKDDNKSLQVSFAKMLLNFLAWNSSPI